MKLDIGCGDHKKQGYIGVDKYDFSELYKAEEFVQHNVKDPLPFEDGSIDEIWCHHMLEHLTHRNPDRDIDYLIWVMNEFHRVLKVGGVAHLIVPWKNHPNNSRHPSHYREFDEWGFEWFLHGGKTLGGEALANGRMGKWTTFKKTRVHIHDNTHIYAILVKEDSYP